MWDLFSGGFDERYPSLGWQQPPAPPQQELPRPGAARVCQTVADPRISHFCSSDFCFIISGFCSLFPPPLKTTTQENPLLCFK